VPSTPRQPQASLEDLQDPPRAARGLNMGHPHSHPFSPVTPPPAKTQSQLAQLVFNAKAGTQMWTSPSNARVVLTGADGRLHEVNLSADSVALC
jgi:hypothetical protein